MKGLLIERVEPGSIADELEIEAGDRLLAVNGEELRDIIDYNYHASDDSLLLEVEKADGELWELSVERGEDERLGLVFPPPKPRRCGNRCVFCFVDQLPKGLRSPLSVKDEDYRLSFLYGNYVTLGNVSEKELSRIREQRLSPLYVSVHATDQELRKRLLGKDSIRPVLDILKELAASRIVMHTQVVLCPGLNDGEALVRTVEDLASLHPFVASLAVVPVGLTSHREGLPELKPVDSAFAAAFLDEWEPKAKELAERLEEPFLFLADEFYVKAGRPFPPLEAYGDLPQIENGVGMVPLFLHEAEEVLAAAEPLSPIRMTAVTGESPYPFLERFAERLSRQTGVGIEVLAVKNRLFGGGVTVTGLVSGRDLVEALREGKGEGTVLVPEVMLKEGEGLFLDGMTPEDVSHLTGRPVRVVEASPWGLYEGIRSFCGEAS